MHGARKKFTRCAPCCVHGQRRPCPQRGVRRSGGHAARRAAPRAVLTGRLSWRRAVQGGPPRRAAHSRMESKLKLEPARFRDDGSAVVLRVQEECEAQGGSRAVCRSESKSRRRARSSSPQHATRGGWQHKCRQRRPRHSGLSVRSRSALDHAPEPAVASPRGTQLVCQRVQRALYTPHAVYAPRPQFVGARGSRVLSVSREEDSTERQASGEATAPGSGIIRPGVPVSGAAAPLACAPLEQRALAAGPPLTPRPHRKRRPARGLGEVSEDGQEGRRRVHGGR